jgi:hypothetical protein
MNEKIRQLAEQAGYSKDYLEIGLPSNMEKFAELLFNEVANTAVISDGMFTGNERRLSVELRLGDITKKISVFGVEE